MGVGLLCHSHKDMMRFFSPSLVLALVVLAVAQSVAHVYLFQLTKCRLLLP